ncbi:MAG: hypothetical protein ACTH4R_13335, partial [Staphylococcus xylosus]
MLKSSLKFNEAFEDSVRKVYARVTIGEKSFTESDIFTIDFESGSVNGPGYQIGSVFSDLVKIKFDKVIRDLKELDKVIVEIGIEREQINVSERPSFNSKVNMLRVGRGKLNKIFYDNPIEFVRLGEFYISERADVNENDNTTTITCMDAIIYFEQQYKPSLKFPADIFDVSVDIANQIGVQINAQSFSHLPKKSIKMPEPMTARQLIGYIAQFACGFIKISKYGVLELKTPKSTEKVIDSSLYYQKGLSKNDLKYRIDGILSRNQTTSEEITSGKTNGSQLVIDNPFINQKDLDYIFEIVKGIEYYPFNLQWYGIPSIEAGDWLIVKDIEDNQYRVPNLSYKLHYNGGLKATSSAETQSQSSELNIFEGPLNREITRLNKEINNTKENAITKESIIEKINTSEETIDGKPLQISGEKIAINFNTKIEDNSIESSALKNLDARKITGKTGGRKLILDFDNEEISSIKSENSKVTLTKGDIKLENNSDLYQHINFNDISNVRPIDQDIILKAIESTVVSMFSVEETDDKLGLIIDSD